MKKTIIIASACDDVHIESQHVDCELKNGVYSYSDAQSDAVVIFVTDVDISQQMFEAMRQFYYHVKCDCDFTIIASDLRANVEENQQLYKYFNEVFNRFLTYEKKYESHKTLDGFDYQTHKHLINQY